ncbi:hypothetical protein BJF87_23895 [Gordonia sp. CNJ-863]|jgi:fucose 4-O-acetylase-like acetyltransferase|nr:hypothetical protein BJF87_23895 [Gordonia sp. CNJ-863]
MTPEESQNDSNRHAPQTTFVVQTFMAVLLMYVTFLIPNVIPAWPAVASRLLLLAGTLVISCALLAIGKPWREWPAIISGTVFASAVLLTVLES